MTPFTSSADGRPNRIITRRGIYGGVYDGLLHELKRLSHWTATIYPGPKQNFVFNAASVWWNQGLASPPGHIIQWYRGVRCHGPDSRVQRITHNLLRRALS